MMCAKFHTGFETLAMLMETTMKSALFRKITVEINFTWNQAIISSTPIFPSSIFSHSLLCVKSFLHCSKVRLLNRNNFLAYLSFCLSKLQSSQNNLSNQHLFFFAVEHNAPKKCQSGRRIFLRFFSAQEQKV